MVQEVLNNIIKHAHASKIVIVIEAKGPMCHLLTISDNGRGFDSTKLQENKSGIGLQNIFTRAKMINSAVTIKSSEQEGTSIIFEITNQPILK